VAQSWRSIVPTAGLLGVAAIEKFLSAGWIGKDRPCTIGNDAEVGRKNAP